MKRLLAILLLIASSINFYGQDIKSSNDEELIKEKEARRKMWDEREKQHQEKNSDTSKSFSLLLCPTEMIYGYETVYLNYKFSKRFLIGVGAGHMFQTKNEGSFSNYEDEYPLLAYNGTIAKGYLYFFPFIKYGFYLGAMAVYKDLYYSWYYFWQAHYTGDHYIAFYKV